MRRVHAGVVILFAVKEGGVRGGEEDSKGSRKIMEGVAEGPIHDTQGSQTNSDRGRLLDEI